MDEMKHRSFFKTIIIPCSILLQGFSFLAFVLLPSDIVLAEKTQRYFPSAKEHSQKIKQIAGIIAVEINRRGIKTVEVKEFTDIRGRPSAVGKDIAKEFERQMAAAEGRGFAIIKNDAKAVVTGTVTPFKEREKWQIKIKVVSAETGAVITAYTGILKKTKGIKK
ncbi:MAG TPA: hypothetical protein DHV16_04410 [Nitrospiraceae bacterium]|nr:MAG: hypothetical protein A2Z82_05645 [Nitrospirae bacterium GWA2_46_11]OGW25908.1 MAG: hypothetical protein A2X55_02975 [Nitrospirae bacterium GWB2_47_37]HAK89027.1 hypothetical protein [Nitrospiraceae bacterium]HCZ11492.1 hypothetical protein [Nitrospiraceae bacterium]